MIERLQNTSTYKTAVHEFARNRCCNHKRACLWRLLENGGAEEAEEIAAAGETEAGDDVRLRHGGASQDAPALKHGDGAAGSGEVCSGDEPVVPAADHHSVPSLSPGQLRRRRGRRSIRGEAAAAGAGEQESPRRRRHRRVLFGFSRREQWRGWGSAAESFRSRRRQV